MKLAAVICDEAAGWASEEGVEEHAEGECEQSLDDSFCEPAGGFREVLFEPHLAFEVAGQSLDRLDVELGSACTENGYRLRPAGVHEIVLPVTTCRLHDLPELRTQHSGEGGGALRRLSQC